MHLSILPQKPIVASASLKFRGATGTCEDVVLHFMKLGLLNEERSVKDAELRRLCKFRCPLKRRWRTNLNDVGGVCPQHGKRSVLT